MKAVIAAFNQEKALVGAFSVIVQLHRLIVTALLLGLQQLAGRGVVPGAGDHGQAAADAAHLHPLLNSDEAILSPVLAPDRYVDKKYIWNVQCTVF